MRRLDLLIQRQNASQFVLEQKYGTIELTCCTQPFRSTHTHQSFADWKPVGTIETIQGSFRLLQRKLRFPLCGIERGEECATYTTQDRNMLMHSHCPHRLFVGSVSVTLLHGKFSQRDAAHSRQS